jgi:lactoylglutathione lyase
MTLISQKIELFVSDLEASSDFYRRVLGFEVGATREVMLEGQLLRHTPIWNGPTMIGIGQLAYLSPEHHLRRAGLDAVRGVGVEFCLYVSDAEIDDYYRRAVRECTTKIEPLVAQPWGARDFRVVDPDGYYVRISTPDKDYRPLKVQRA